MNKVQEFIEALQEGKAYGWIANHGHELSKDELISIIKEYEYAIFTMGFCEGKEDLYDTIYEALVEQYEEYEEE